MKVGWNHAINNHQQRTNGQLLSLRVFTLWGPNPGLTKMLPLLGFQMLSPELKAAGLPGMHPAITHPAGCSSDSSDPLPLPPWSGTSALPPPQTHAPSPCHPGRRRGETINDFEFCPCPHSSKTCAIQTVWALEVGFPTPTPLDPFCSSQMRHLNSCQRNFTTNPHITLCQRPIIAFWAI